jgi:hypothetical protein
MQFMTPRCATEEFRKFSELPPNFVVIPTSMDKEMNVESAYRGIFSDSNVFIDSNIQDFKN